ncbi:hypothetical protein HMPREF9620_00429 [Cutibacterium acnes HL037PA1]|nr:hypothetical protein HMPREF9567_00220 [Cutibacterium acnes HL013PA1]EFS38913.1 hypothetical protein HMPREF9574_00943 [Cutibacterium acnes HL074PA1]EFS41097.1 hypothetical protein HMPREF9575_01125 [Cutibacterium acnes HL110PA1]EFS69563.1 hypothetical protein HMPREF9616_00654 [Cutibacterium acnes HL007PA1]EFT13642.1 hypothetical protein HMPREF9620_00429 [Cutibacterium acnes HL037PA1]EFT29797.1 hypothetical protein HMPREF9594_00294 [Cutibacterium acnes HL005PA1]EGE92175.1 hypothetical protein
MLTPLCHHRHSSTAVMISPVSVSRSRKRGIVEMCQTFDGRVRPHAN